ncbi:Hypothetical protein HVIM_03962 (plasmid) [Roseomonas mucosa]|nr:MAG: hypothetical protein DI601_07695 [Azospirillum brasilense]QDD92771.1 Hypothetical protein HVIM_03962 [Roseomonas mucosa]
MMYRVIAALTAMIGLSACSASDGVSTSSRSATLTGVVCPPSGTLVTRDDGTHLRYGGTDSRDPAVCLVGTPSGTTARALGGLVATHPTNESVRRQALASLFPLEPGRSSYAQYGLVTPLNPSANSTPFEESFRVVGEKSYQMHNQTRPAWVVETRLNSIMDPATRFVTIYEIDKQTGVVLSQTTTSPTGAVPSPALRSYRVTDIEVPSSRVASGS